MPQSATLIAFRSAIPAILHFDLFGFRLEIMKSFQKSSKFQLHMFGF